MDSEGFLWNCRYGGGCVVRLAPDGRIDRVVELPCGNVTTCTFGGAELADALHHHRAGRAGRSERLAGSVFALDGAGAGAAGAGFPAGLRLILTAR